MQGEAAGVMWWRAGSKLLTMLPTPGKRCTGILVALSIVLLTVVLYQDGAHEAQVPGKQRSMGQKNAVDNIGGSRDGIASVGDFQNINALGRDAIVEGRVKDNVMESYSRTKGNEDLDLKHEENKLKVDSVNTTTTTTTTTTTNSSTKPKTILFYTKFSWKWVGNISGNASRMSQCPISNCVLLENSTHPEEADAVVFHVNDFEPESVPSRRRPDQIYVWFSLEAPTWNGFGLPQPGRSYKSLGIKQRTKKSFGPPGFFNWTSTYHRESDVMHPYGGLVPLEGEKDDYVRPGLLKKSGAAYTEFMAALDRGDTLKDEAFLWRPKLVAWMVSHCKTSSGRERYVEELRQHIQVDVYGACGELKCDGDRKKCYQEVLTPTYKFYLAFENSLCEDYVTEKMWNPQHDGMVPVVYGGAQYSDILPPHSYVDATDLTPIQLANLLYSIVNSPQLYGRYHLWRKYWTVVLTPPLCELCLKLHSQGQEGSEGALRRQSYHSLSDWWWSASNCTTHYPSGSPPRVEERTILHWCLLLLFTVLYR